MTETLTPETIVEDTTPSKPKRYQKDIETIDECFMCGRHDLVCFNQKP